MSIKKIELVTSDESETRFPIARGDKLRIWNAVVEMLEVLREIAIDHLQCRWP